MGVGIGLLVIIFGTLIIRGIVISRKFKKIECGMSYEEVETLVGPPKNSSMSGDVFVCIWVSHIMRGWSITRVISFDKNSKAISIMSDENY